MNSTQRPCDHHAATLAAARGDDWTVPLRRHVEACDECSDWVLVEAYLSRAAATSRAEAPLPDPTAIWWRAQRDARRAQASRVAGMIRWTERVAVAVAGTTAAGVLLTRGDAIASALARLIPTSSAEASAAMPLGPMGLAALAVLLSLAAVASYTSWAEG